MKALWLGYAKEGGDASIIVQDEKTVARLLSGKRTVFTINARLPLSVADYNGEFLLLGRRVYNLSNKSLVIPPFFFTYAKLYGDVLLFVEGREVCSFDLRINRRIKARHSAYNAGGLVIDKEERRVAVWNQDEAIIYTIRLDLLCTIREHWIQEVAITSPW
ncbi:MAG TPA: hypothetical protein VEF04_18680 [Blastocatellia bacterium]|nr:hypothetical protein [Blastocatellia bacterium]